MGSPRTLESDNPNLAVVFILSGLVLHDFQCPLRRIAAHACANQWEGNRAVALLSGNPKCAADATTNHPLRRTPEQADASYVDDGAEGQPASAGLDRSAQRNWSVSSQLAERLVSGAALDGPVDALRQQQPSRDDIAVPSVDDDFDVLVEQISTAYSKGHCIQRSLADQRRLLSRYLRLPLPWTNSRIRSVS